MPSPKTLAELEAEVDAAMSCQVLTDSIREVPPNKAPEFDIDSFTRRAVCYAAEMREVMALMDRE